VFWRSLYTQRIVLCKCDSEEEQRLRVLNRLFKTKRKEKKRKLKKVHIEKLRFMFVAPTTIKEI
jgi:hypothetical protein